MSQPVPPRRTRVARLFAATVVATLVAVPLASADVVDDEQAFLTTQMSATQAFIDGEQAFVNTQVGASQQFIEDEQRFLNQQLAATQTFIEDEQEFLRSSGCTGTCFNLQPFIDDEQAFLAQQQAALNRFIDDEQAFLGSENAQLNVFVDAEQAFLNQQHANLNKFIDDEQAFFGSLGAPTDGCIPDPIALIGSCFVGNPATPQDPGPADEGLPASSLVQTAATVVSDTPADYGTPLWIGAGQAILAAGAVDSAIDNNAASTTTRSAAVFLRPSSSTEGAEELALISSAPVAADGSFILTTSWTDTLAAEAAKSVGKLNFLLRVVESNGGVFEWDFARTVSSVAGKLSFLDSTGQVPGLFNVSFADGAPGASRMSVAASESLTGAAATAARCTISDKSNLDRWVTVGELHGTAHTAATFGFGTSKSSEQMIGVISSTQSDSGYKVSGEASNNVGTSSSVSGRIGNAGSELRRRVIAQWRFERHKRSCTQYHLGPGDYAGTTVRWEVVPKRWNAVLDFGNVTGSVCGNSQNAYAYANGSEYDTRSSKTMTWSAGVTLFGVSVASTNQHSADTTHHWKFDNAGRSHHVVCGTDDKPFLAKRTYAGL